MSSSENWKNKAPVPKEPPKTEREKQIEAQLKKSGMSQKEIDKLLRGKK